MPAPYTDAENTGAPLVPLLVERQRDQLTRRVYEESINSHRFETA